jgi:putative methyltransferase (TIGR04325 family)
MHTKDLTRSLCPPVIWNLAKRAKAGPKKETGFKGPYASWKQAVDNSNGWNSPEILEKAVAAAEAVIAGQAEFEQDTIVREHIRYSPLILGFLYLAGTDRVDVVDFGGSVATNYLQNRKLIAGIPRTWRIVEIPELVKVANQRIQIDGVSFHARLREVLPATNILYSGSLQYLEHPFDSLQETVDGGAQLIALDRLLVSRRFQSEIYVQQPSSRYYASSYPVWGFSLTEITRWFETRGFHLVEHFASETQMEGPFAQCGLLFSK